MQAKQHRVNTVQLVLLVAIAIVNLYTLVLPFWPALTFWWQKHHSQKQQQLSSLVASTEVPSDNRLVIPAALVDAPVLEGQSESTVHRGIWHLPASSTPPQGGNTVLAGHRFTYDGKGVFYNLDKITVGDQLALFWNGKKYTYTVTETKVVPATATEIEANTANAQLTIYTCTPLWTAKDRLVIIAKPEQEEAHE